MQLNAKGAPAMPNDAPLDMSALVWDWTELTTVVTPAMAKQFLAKQHRNRVLSREHLQKLKADIETGLWYASPNIIAFNQQNELIDGQHRCTAIVETGRSLPCILVGGFPPETIDVIDTGRKRTLGDTLTIKGAQNSNILAAAMRHIYWYCELPEQQKFTIRTMTTALAVQTFPPDSGRFYLLQTAAKMAAVAAPVCSPSFLTTVMFLGCTANDRWHMGREFCDGIKTGEDLSATDPRLVFRNRMLQVKASRMKLPLDMQLALIVRAWNAYVTGRPMAKISVGKDLQNVEIPTIDGCPRGEWPAGAEI